MLLLLQCLPHKLSGILRDCRPGIVPCQRRLQDIESDTGYDTRRRVPDGALAGVSQTAVYDTCGSVTPGVSKAYGSQALNLRDALQAAGVDRQDTAQQSTRLAARGENQSAFDERRILAACVAPSSNTGGILSRRALSTRRLARLGATPDFRHWLLARGQAKEAKR